MMKNKLCVAGLLAALACGLVLSGCENKILDVKIVSDKANAVSEVKATLTTDTTNVIVSWDAVENASGYVVYLKQGSSKSVNQIGYGQNQSVYAEADGTPSANTDADKWSYLLNTSGMPAGEYTLGVRTSSIEYNVGYSDIKWSNTVTKP
ncbi:MAG: hypothetical protein LBD96_02120 [Treponema sp.]|jgi:hypothetical protein|nr:hypothetical protein [Treponema sp.]